MAQHFHLFRVLAISRESCSACPTLLFSAETQPYFALLYGRQRPTQVILVLWDHRFTKNPTDSCPHPQCAKWKSLPEPQGSTRMGVNEERSGRCSPGHHFQEDYTYEHAVPSDRSLAASAAQKWLQLSFSTQESAFLRIFQESLSESSPIGTFHADVTALASSRDVFAKQKFHILMASWGDPRQGWESAHLLAEVGVLVSGRQKGKVGIATTLNILGERANWKPFFMPNHFFFFFCSTPKGIVAFCIWLRKAKGLNSQGLN